MPKRIPAALLTGCLWLTGCENLLPPNLLLMQGSASIQITPQIVSGGYLSQALVDAYDAEDVAQLVLSLSRLDGEQEILVEDAQRRPVRRVLSRAQFQAPVRFEGLLPATTYRIRGHAYKAEGENLDDLISKTDETSYVDVAIKQDDAPISKTLKVQLIDVHFNGKASASGVLIIPGGYVTEEPLSIALGPESELISAESPFWQEYAPRPVVGMAWIYRYTATSNGSSMSAEIRMEVQEVNGDAVTIGVLTSPDDSPPQQQSQMGDLRRYHGFPDSSGRSFARAGTEAVTVPAGSYPEAIRMVNRTATQETILWVTKGVGRIREEHRSLGEPGSDASVVLVLEQFVSP